MICLPPAGFVPKCGQKLSPLDRDLGGLATLGEEAAVAAKYVKLGYFASSFAWRLTDWAELGERQEWAFWIMPGCAGGSN